MDVHGYGQSRSDPKTKESQPHNKTRRESITISDPALTQFISHLCNNKNNEKIMPISKYKLNCSRNNVSGSGQPCNFICPESNMHTRRRFSRYQRQ